MRPRKDAINTENGQKQRRFDECLTKLMKYSSETNVNYSLQDDLVDACVSLINKTNLTPEQRKKNSSYVVGHFQGKFAKYFSKKALVLAFEKISVWLDLDEKEKEETRNVLGKYKIKCSDKCKKRFLPQPRNSFFDRVDDNPKAVNVIEYANHLFTRKPPKSTDMRYLFNLLDKYRAIHKSEASQISLCGQTTDIMESGHKRVIKSVIDLYQKKTTIVNRNFLYSLVSQTNFNDEEALKLEKDFDENKDVIVFACKKRREADVSRLNSYLFSFDDKGKKDKLSFASHRSVYVSLLHQALVEGKDIADVDMKKEYFKQRRHLKKTLVSQFKENQLNNNGSEHGKWSSARDEVHQLIAKDDSLKILQIQKYLAKSPYIDKESYFCLELESNLNSLRGDEKGLHYYIKGAINHFEM
ncbi:MAG: hypothetical protein R3Y43_01065 [Alphaproteobacteria bacterium]